MRDGHRTAVGKITSPTGTVKGKSEHTAIPLGLEDLRVCQIEKEQKRNTRQKEHWYQKSYN